MTFDRLRAWLCATTPNLRRLPHEYSNAYVVTEDLRRCRQRKNHGRRKTYIVGNRSRQRKTYTVGNGSPTRLGNGAIGKQDAIVNRLGKE